MSKAKRGQAVEVLVERTKPRRRTVEVLVEGVAVSRPALMARINRRLARDERRLLAARGARARQDLGAFYVIDAAANTLVSGHVDPEAFARELGVLRAWEKVE